MKKIRLLVDCHYFETFYSGVTTYIKGIYNELVNCDDLEIYLASTTTEKLAKDFPGGRFRYIKLNSGFHLKRTLYEIPKLIQKYGIEYAHFQYTVPILKRCKYLVTIHDILFEDYPDFFPLAYRIPRSILFRLSAQKADIVFTVSEYSRKQISTHYGIPYETILVTPNGVCDDRICQEGAKNKGEQYILYVSRLEPRKNHKTLIEAFIELKLYEQYRLVMIGRQSIKDKDLYRYIKNLNGQVRGKIQHIDNVTDKKLKEYYRNASLFVYPSIAEGFGIPPLEAIMSNTKVICSNATAMSDYGFMKGYQFAPLDKGMLKRLILRTLDDNNYPFARMQAEIRSKYNWSVGAKVLFDGIMKDAGRWNKPVAESNTKAEINNLACCN
jgi:glycosyltransferase involved in cell wall biosynthesis